LPDAIRAGIVAMVKAAGNAGEQQRRTSTAGKSKGRSKAKGKGGK